MVDVEYLALKGSSLYLCLISEGGGAYEHLDQCFVSRLYSSMCLHYPVQSTGQSE